MGVGTVGRHTSRVFLRRSNRPKKQRKCYAAGGRYISKWWRALYPCCPYFWRSIVSSRPARVVLLLFTCFLVTGSLLYVHEWCSRIIPSLPTPQKTNTPTVAYPKSIRFPAPPPLPLNSVPSSTKKDFNGFRGFSAPTSQPARRWCTSVCEPIPRPLFSRCSGN